jgi:hypothetical protein
LQGQSCELTFSLSHFFRQASKDGCIENQSNPRHPPSRVFTDVTGGIQFDIADVSEDASAKLAVGEGIDFKDIKGFDLYFKQYLAQETFNPCITRPFGRNGLVRSEYWSAGQCRV